MSNKLPIYLVDDERHILTASKLLLQGGGIGNSVETVQDSRELIPLLDRQVAAAIVLDLFMPKPSGLELLPLINQRYPQIPVIVMTAMNETETAVDCMKKGAFDFLVKPVEAGRLITSVRKALDMHGLHQELTSLKDCLLTDRLNDPDAFSAIVTGSKKMRAIFQYIEVVAPSSQPILITGETGVGKEMIAKAVHVLSGSKGPFVAVNVAGVDDNMFSDCLFGHKKGAFTGADQPREGFIAKAAGGTLFLDEIGDLNEMSQIKLLRLLQEREYYPVGSDIAKKSDARIVTATNRDLQKAIQAGKFRNDLYYRLCSHQIHIPPLRERIEDIPLLLDHFLGEAAKSLGKKKPTPPNELATLLATYNFPGNIRELQAMIHDAVARHSSGILSMESFKKLLGDERSSLSQVDNEGAGKNGLLEIFGRFPTVREMEDYLIAEAMAMAKGNQGIAASLLGVTRQTLNKRLKTGTDGS